MKQISRLGLGARDALSEGAALAQRIPGFVARPAQQRLAMAVADAFEHRGVEGADIGEHAVLVSLAAAVGLDGFAARRFLGTSAEVEAVHSDNLRAHRLGINGVPCFVVAGRHAIAGAQEPEVLERLLDVALVEG